MLSVFQHPSLTKLPNVQFNQGDVIGHFISNSAQDQIRAWIFLCWLIGLRKEWAKEKRRKKRSQVAVCNGSSWDYLVCHGLSKEEVEVWKPASEWKFNHQGRFQARQTIDVIRSPCHKLLRIRSVINMLQKDLKEQTQNHRHALCRVSCHFSWGSRDLGAAYVAVTQAPWLETGLEAQAQPG